jgi:hypothetical protein
MLTMLHCRGLPDPFAELQDRGSASVAVTKFISARQGGVLMKSSTLGFVQGGIRVTPNALIALLLRPSQAVLDS